MIVCLAFFAVAVSLAPRAQAQSAVTFFPPTPVVFFQEAEFAIQDSVGLLFLYNASKVWSFSLNSGARIDPEGLAFSGIADVPALFAGHRLASAGWYADVPGVLVVDVSHPANLAPVGVIRVPTGSNIQGQNIAVGPDGVTGFVASFANDRLYSFNVQTMALVDPDGLVLPGSPDRIARAADRVAIVDSRNGRILVADVSDPSNLRLAGVIELPESATFGSESNIEFSDDGRTGFVPSRDRTMYSFDVLALVMLDPDGVSYGTTSVGMSITRSGSTIGCLWGRGLAFVDASDPTDMKIRSDANFGEVVAPQGSARVGFSDDGTQAAVPIVYPGSYVYSFVVATGQQLRPRFTVTSHPNYLKVFGRENRVGVSCTGPAPVGVWLITGLLDSTRTVDPGPHPAPRPDTSLVIAPNPSPGPVRISFGPAPEGGASLAVLDVEGRLVRRLPVGSGWRSVEWDGTDSSGRPLRSGTYWVRIETANAVSVGRLVLTR